MVLKFLAVPFCEGEPGGGVGGEVDAGLLGGLGQGCYRKESEEMSAIHSKRKAQGWREICMSTIAWCGEKGCCADRAIGLIISL